MILNLIPPVSIWGDEVSPTLKMVPSIGSPLFNDIHLNPEPDLTLTLNYAIDYIPWLPHQNHSFPPIYITVLTPILISVTSRLFMRYFLCFYAQYFQSLIVLTHREYVSIFPNAMISWGHWIWLLSCEMPFGSYSLWPGFTCILHLFLIPFSTCGVQWDVLFIIGIVTSCSRLVLN